MLLKKGMLNFKFNLQFNKVNKNVICISLIEVSGSFEISILIDIEQPLPPLPELYIAFEKCI